MLSCLRYACSTSLFYWWSPVMLLVFMIVSPGAAQAEGMWEARGPSGAWVNDIVGVDDIVLAATKSGLYRSTDDGTTWSFVDQPFEHRWVYVVVADQSAPGTFYAGVSSNDRQLPGLYRSDDWGATWEPIDTGLTYRQGVRSDGVSVAAVHPTTGAVYVSATWVHACTLQLHRSTDHGASWQPMDDWPGSESCVLDLDFSLSNPDIVVVIADRIASQSFRTIHRSVNGGGGWVEIASGWYEFTTVDPEDPEHIFAAMDWGLERTTNGGRTWAQAGNFPEPWPGHFQTLRFDPGQPSHIVVGTNRSVHSSNDGGQTWEGAITGLKNRDVSSFSFLDGTDAVLCAGRGGVHRSRDGGFTWATTNEGMSATTANAVRPDPHRPAIVHAATQAGLFTSTDGGRNWAPQTHKVSSTGSIALAVGHDNGQSLYTSLWSDDLPGVFRTSDGGAIWENITEGLLSYLTRGIIVDPRDAGTVYAVNINSQSKPRLFRSEDRGDNWTRVRSYADNCCWTYALDPARPDRVIGGGYGFVYSEDRGDTWRRASSSQSPGSIASFAFDPETPSRAYAGGSNVFATDDGGSSWTRTYTRGWPEGPYEAHLAIDPTNTLVVLGGNRQGIWRTPDIESLPWVPFNDGLPFSPGIPDVYDLQFDDAGGAVWAATESGTFVYRYVGLDRVAPGVGPTAGDTLVILEGPGLDENSSVRFGDSEAGWVWSLPDDHLLVATPPHPEGVVDVWVYNQEGRGAMMVDAFTFSDTMAPDLELTPQTLMVTVAGDKTMRVSLPSPTATDVEVTLECTRPDLLDVPATVMIGAGERSASFSVRGLATGAGVYIVATSPDTQAVTRALVVPGGSWPSTLSVPGQARVEGAGGAYFKSTMWMTNPETTDTVVQLRYVPADGQEDGGGDSQTTVILPGKRSVVFEDVLRDAFASVEDTFGVVVVRVPPGFVVPVVSARTFNDTAEGTYGQYIPAVDIGGADQQSQLLAGLGADEKTRTNIGVVNLDSRALEATITVLDAAGEVRGDVLSSTVAPLSQVQVNRVNQAANAGRLPVFAVRVDSDGPFFAYASRLDNVTSDPIYVPGTMQPSAVQYVDGIAQVEGLGDTLFRSNLALSSAESQDLEVEIFFAGRGQSSFVSFGVLPIAAGATLFYNDVVGELLEKENVVGTLRLEASAPLVAWARTYNDGGDAGTYGQFIPAFGGSHGADILPAAGAIFHGLSEDEAFRTNMGFFNLGDAGELEVQLTVYSTAATKIASDTISLPPSQAVFVNRVLRSLGADGSRDVYIHVRPSAGDQVYAWASMVDNVSSDQTFIRPLVVNEATP